MRINLMPVVPKTRRFKFPISLIVAIIVIIPSVLVGWDVWDRSLDYSEQKNILKSLETKSVYYAEQLELSNDDSHLLKEYFKEYNLLKAESLDWVVVFDGLTSKLPADAIINSLSFNGLDGINVDAEFTSVFLGAQYIQWLETIDWIDGISSVQSFTESGNSSLAIDLIINTQSLLKGGNIND